MPRDTAALRKSLRKKGFEETNRKDEEEYVYPGTLIKTHFSRGPREDIREVLEKKIAHQMHLTKEEFRRFVDCPLNREEYAAILRRKKLIH